MGAINFNNMIPVCEDNIIKISLDEMCVTDKEKKYQKLLKEQIYWLNRNSEKLYGRAEKLYNSYIDGKLDKKTSNRCCDFKILEEKCEIYNKGCCR